MKLWNTAGAKAFLFALVYGVSFYLLQFILVRTGMFLVEPTELNIKSWDVGYYDSIAREGYRADSNNTGFFILFPLIWKITQLGVWGMCALNLLFFSLGFALLTRVLAEENRTVYLLWLTLPSVYFAFIPYTESLFFLLVSILLYALKEKRYGLLWMSLFLLSLVRATAVFLLPAFLAMELLRNPYNRWWHSLATAMYRYVLPMVLALGIFIVIQYQETGIWFAYFKTQSSHWGHVFTVPGLPFNNIENGNFRYHWLSALAMLIDTIALLFLAKQGVSWLKKKETKDEVLLLSAGYLMMVLFSLLFLNPKYGGTQTNIMGANRYTFITPFFFVFLHYLSNIKYNNRQVLYLFLLANAFWSLFGAHEELNKYIAFALINNFLIVAFMLYTRRGQHNWLIIPIIAWNLLAQLHFFQQFITPLYVD